jgi:hypothetical protein
MPDFDPETFEEEKYVEHFPQLQTAYKRAFDRLNGEYDSQLVHAIDQQILDESEPVFEDGDFHLELPADPLDRLQGVVVSDERASELLEEYVAEIERQLRDVFDVDEPKA